MAMGNVGGEDMEYNTTINVVPLVDVMLVLLIIFIITLPVMTHAVKIDLPRATNDPPPPPSEAISIDVQYDGSVYWNDNPATLDHLAEMARVEAVKDPQPEVHIRADKRVAYSYVGDVLTTLQRNYLLKVAFIAEPPHQD